MESRRVLVADDDEDAAMSLGDLLTLLGHEVSVALDVSSALAMAAQQKPDLVLIEIGMQGGAGLDACRTLRQSLPRQATAIVALSAWTRLRDRLEAYDAGCSVYLFKPVEVDVLEALLAGGEAFAAYEALASYEALAAYEALATAETPPAHEAGAASRVRSERDDGSSPGGATPPNPGNRLAG